MRSNIIGTETTREMANHIAVLIINRTVSLLHPRNTSLVHLLMLTLVVRSNGGHIDLRPGRHVKRRSRVESHPISLLTALVVLRFSL